MQNLRSAVMPVIENITPVIESTRNLLARVAPKIEETTADLAAISHTLRNQVADVQVATDEIIARARRQASRVDSMVSNMLDTVDRAGAFMASTVTKPMRQLSALLASAKAVMESLRSTDGATRARANRASGDDLFV
jgi:signal transduction histidine kinase